MKFRRWNIELVWELNFKKGIYPREDYVIFDWWLIGFIKFKLYRERNDRVRI